MPKKNAGTYVEGFVLTVPKKKLNAYRRMATLASQIWREYGALEYAECVGDDMKVKMGVSFPKLAKAKAGEVVVFAWITYRSRADRNKVNAAVMKDPRLSSMCDPSNPPFDMKRMSYGGFKTIVSA